VRIGVIGAGAWGTTLANMLACQGNDVMIWAREPDVVESINRRHVNDTFLPASPLVNDLQASADILEVVRDRNLLVSAAPTHAVRSVMTKVAPVLARPKPVVVSVSKGLEPGTLDTMAVVLESTLPGCPVVVLSGPSFAQEVYRQQPTAVVAASDDPHAAEIVQQTFSTNYFRVYTSTDVVGVELGGALKNVIAIAAGILEGLGLGHNSQAGLITRGLAEMTRLGEALGAQPATLAGLAGMGDLILTATGALSRNRSLGIELGRGKSLEAILAERRSIAEGVGTARVAVELGKKAGVELPITSEVAQILFGGKLPRDAVRAIMDRELKAEQWR
jgi:glycerol-3-phosphate dehydrogenase (NAD(P)+)